MKVVWVVYPVFPDFAVKIGHKPPLGGGWMYGLAKDLVKEGISLSVVTARPGMVYRKEKIENIDYYLLNGKKDRELYDRSLESIWKKLIKNIQPDVIHIHGTEYAIGLSLMNTCPNEKYVISIQGMTSVYARYYLGGISRNEVMKNYTLRDFLRRDTLLQAQKKFYWRGVLVEIPYIKKAQHIIGRTQWDHDHVKTINPQCRYHFCNESLRDSFYKGARWSPKYKIDYQIFVSQAGYPLKGLHKVLDAIAIVKEFFPEVKIRVARNNITKSDSLKDRLRIGGYGKYIRTLIHKKEIKKHVDFTGPLNADQMVEEYLRCNLFICPSSIENSPNSLGEAQLLGVPCIASYVGGVPDMVEHNKTGLLYRYEEVEMLAQRIMEIFRDEQLATKLSRKANEEAAKRHNRKTNADRLIEIYRNI